MSPCPSGHRSAPAACRARSLHKGHGFETALIDTIVRFQRLLGKSVLCLPGTYHASSAVQTIHEKQLKAEDGSAAFSGDDPEPPRHQVEEIPAIVPFVIEYQLHRLNCPCCRTVTAAVLAVTAGY